MDKVGRKDHLVSWEVVSQTNERWFLKQKKEVVSGGNLMKRNETVLGK